MKIINIKQLVFSEIKVIEFERFSDNRGYFTETFRSSDLKKVIPDFKIVQANESFSQKKVVRGLHFQWNPYMGKLVRVIFGYMIDLFLDIRLGSPNYGKIGTYKMKPKKDDKSDEWIWIPPGFAHGNIFLEDSKIEYFCTGEYSQICEASISPLSPDINWSMCESSVEKLLKEEKIIISDKDKNGLTVGEWSKDKRAKNFIYK